MFNNNEDKNMIESYNYSEINSLLNEFKQDQKELEKIVDEIKKEKNIKKIKRFLSEYERIFLKYKVLNLYLKKDLDKEIINSFIQNDPIFCGINNSFKSKLTIINQDYLLYVLPSFIGNREFENGSYLGDFTSNIIQYLTINLLNKENRFFNKIYKGTVVFEHHFNKNNKRNNLVDPDNIEAKKALDGLNGLILEDDSILNINLIHVSKSDTSEYTKLHVIRNEYINTWLLKHLDLFKK